jgi:hypothetical protein
MGPTPTSFPSLDINEPLANGHASRKYAPGRSSGHIAAQVGRERRPERNAGGQHPLQRWRLCGGNCTEPGFMQDA